MYADQLHDFIPFVNLLYCMYVSHYLVGIGIKNDLKREVNKQWKRDKMNRKVL